MERVLEGAVEHGVAMIRDRMQAVLPAEMQFISDNAKGASKKFGVKSISLLAIKS